MNKIYFGSCLCSIVKFEIEGNFENFFLCHCKFCQKDTGTAHGANLFSTIANLNWKSGKENIKTFNLKPTRHTKSFCLTCGSALPYLLMDGKLLVVPAGSLDTDVELKPDAHIFSSSKACWDNELETIKKFEKFPS